MSSPCVSAVFAVSWVKFAVFSSFGWFFRVPHPLPCTLGCFFTVFQVLGCGAVGGSSEARRNFPKVAADREPFELYYFAALGSQVKNPTHMRLHLPIRPPPRAALLWVWKKLPAPALPRASSGSAAFLAVVGGAVPQLPHPTTRIAAPRGEVLRPTRD